MVRWRDSELKQCSVAVVQCGVHCAAPISQISHPLCSFLTYASPCLLPCTDGGWLAVRSKFAHGSVEVQCWCATGIVLVLISTLIASYCTLCNMLAECEYRSHHFLLSGVRQ